MGSFSASFLFPPLPSPPEFFFVLLFFISHQLYGERERGREKERKKKKKKKEICFTERERKLEREPCRRWGGSFHFFQF